MPWWLWILIGFALLAGESLTPGGFFVFFFGVSAIVVGGLTAAEVSGSVQSQWLLFSALSVISLLLLRPKLVDRFRAPAGGNTPLPDFIGDAAVLLDDLEPGAVGKAELRGTSWNVRSRESTALPRGSRCTVERVEGLTLWVRPQNSTGGGPA